MQEEVEEEETPRVEQAIEWALEDESATTLDITANDEGDPLTVIDSQRIIACLQQTPRVDTLEIYGYSLHDNVAALNVLRDGLPLCTSITTVKLVNTQLTNEDLDRLRPAFYNTSVRKLYLNGDNILGRRGGEVLRDLLVGNETLLELHLALMVLDLSHNPRLGPLGACALAPGLAAARHLEVLSLLNCRLGNEGVANLILPDGQVNRSLTKLVLENNDIEGEDGGRQLTLLLQRFTALTVLDLHWNRRLGPLGARGLAPGLAAAIHLESLDLRSCGLGNDGVANLIPEGQVNRSLTYLHLGNNDIQGLEGGENVVALVAHCTNLDSLALDENILNSDQLHRLDMLLERNRLLITEASALGGSTFPVLFRFVEKAHRHEHGLSAIFVILQNDGDDYFCIALNRAID